MSRKTEFDTINRELSWLSFNERVLQEAEDSTVPLGERLNFLGIFSSNLDEFFRVRVASLRSLLRLKPKRVEELGFSPADVLHDIHRVVTAQQNRFGDVFRNSILPALARHGVHIVPPSGLTPDQASAVTAWFDQQVAPLCHPLVLRDGQEPPFLGNREVHLVVELWPAAGGGVVGDAPDYALVNVPSPPLPRFLTLPVARGGHAVMFLDDVIRFNLARMFPQWRTGGAYAVKLTRDAELYLEDEFTGDLVQSIRKSLKKRETGPPSRFLYDQQAPYPLVERMRALLGLTDEDLVLGGRYHNLHDLCGFPRFGIPELSHPPLPPLPHHELENAPSLLAAIAERDRLLHFPYHRFDYVIRLLEEAADDPDVEEIWITLYRVARESAVAEALARAAAAGKRVTAFVEVKARFDEETNLACGERLERAGVRTLYSLPGLKVHAKLALIVRREADETVSYAYLATGNFNERTARIYSDLALLTADPRLTTEVRRVFAFLAGEVQEPEFEHLLVAPIHLRKQFYRLIEREAEAAAQGLPAGMTLKMNSLEDPRIIARLYQAAQTGMDIRLIVRGICCLMPGLAGETLHARSIVDRFLEHARIFLFENRGDPLCYLSSADWMTRNLSRRVEVCFPIYDMAIKREIRSIIELQLADNQKARVLDDAQSNRYLAAAAPETVRTQIDTWRLLRSRFGAAVTASAVESRIDHVNPAHA